MHTENLIIHIEDNESPLSVFVRYFPNNTNPERSVKDITRRVISAYTEVEGLPIEDAIKNTGKTKQEINLQVIMLIENEYDFLLELVSSDLEDTIKKPLNEFRDRELMKQDCIHTIQL